MQQSRRNILVALVCATLGLFELALITFDVPRPSDLVAFAAFAAITDLFEISGANRMNSSLGTAPAFAFVVLGGSPLEGALAYACGALITRLARLMVRRKTSFAEAGLGVLVVLGAGTMYTAVAAIDPLPPIGPSVSPAGILAALVVGAVADIIVKAAMAARRGGASVRSELRSTVVPLGILHIAVMSVAGLLALTYPEQGLLSMPLLLGPIAVAHYAYGRLASAQRLYTQTIEALSQVPELAGYATAGHAQRVSELAIAIARELDADVAEVEQTRYAALLHEIGRLALPDPTDEGDGAVTLAEVAEAGAAVAAETRHLPRVAEIIRHQHVPYRQRGSQRKRDVPLGARIIKVVCAYDAFRSNARLARSAWEALEHLYLGLTYEYDPAVVQALVRVLERRGEPETGLVYDATKQRNADRVKQDFVSTVSHELRTPLTPIRGYASLLLAHGDGLAEDTKKEALESILAGADRLQRLIDDLILASSIAVEGERAMCASVEPKAAGIEEIVRQAMRPFVVEHPSRSFTISCDEALSALVDRRLLVQVLGNILSNAVKFSPEGSPVDLRVERHGARVAIAIADRGSGISASALDTIFQKFTRLEDPLKMETGGAGLGLFIVRQLLTAMSGTVTVSSEPGRGSTFTVWLPVAGDVSEPAIEEDAEAS